MSMDPAIEGERAAMEILSDYYDFGVAVGVEAPPASRVLDVADEMEAGTSQG
jgi:hypothetical protein